MMLTHPSFEAKTNKAINAYNKRLNKIANRFTKDTQKAIAKGTVGSLGPSSILKEGKHLNL